MAETNGVAQNGGWAREKEKGVPEKDLKKLEAEQQDDDADVLADLDKESKEFDKVSTTIYKARPMSLLC